MVTYTGGNPTRLYYQALKDLIEDGDTLAPRGKTIKELRPVCFEFTRPRERVTFLPGRQINPFFQLVEAEWILKGSADVSGLDFYNSNMKNFSDDGEWFNAPYGERLRSWGKNSLRGFIFNPLDQLYDVYRKILNDKDTRQAVAVIYDPRFDNYDYTVGEQGKDIACNLVLTFKVRDNKLNLTVFNRSNDIHWGLFGANLNQFTTIQETIWSWLRYSGESEFKDLELGTYTHITDSLHVYLDDYGASCTDKILDALEAGEPVLNLMLPVIEMSSGINQFHYDISVEDGCSDAYLNLIHLAKQAYRYYKKQDHYGLNSTLDAIPECNWKLAMLRFLKKFMTDDESNAKEYRAMLDDMNIPFRDSVYNLMGVEV